MEVILRELNPPKTVWRRSLGLGGGFGGTNGGLRGLLVVRDDVLRIRSGLYTCTIIFRALVNEWNAGGRLTEPPSLSLGCY